MKTSTKNLLVSIISPLLIIIFAWLCGVDFGRNQGTALMLAGVFIILIACIVSPIWIEE